MASRVTNAAAVGFCDNPGMKFRGRFLTFAVVGLTAAVAGVLLARMLTQRTVVLEGGTFLPQPRTLAAFELQDTRGARFDNASLQGRPHLLFFGFTYCPDVCPTTLATLAEVHAEPRLKALSVLFVSVDPQRDTAAAVREYLKAFSPDFIGVRGEPAAMAPLLKSLGGIATRQSLPDGNYTMDHTAAIYLLDRQGRYAAVFTPPFTPTRLRQDLLRVAAAGWL